ncbi:hypothetical protein [Enterobacter sp. DE0047]|uniref:hypothetical protein n=1 Tax=Enterobacter sp. DE0047 TaxID=2584949 RepID=UPI0011A57BE3|nr:hypothetical protein [Enterobacter sp. DE0047]
MKLFLFSLLTLSAISAHAAPEKHSAPAGSVYGTYEGNNPRYGKNSLTVGPDSFKNRVRYWFISSDGSSSVYYIALKIGTGKYREINVNADGEAAQLIFHGNSATLQSRHAGQVVNSVVFVKVNKATANE